MADFSVKPNRPTLFSAGEISSRRLSAGRASPANQLSHGSKLATSRAPRMRFYGAIEADHALPDGSNRGASAAAAAGLRGDRGLAQGVIYLFDQKPRPAIGHPERAGARR